MRPGGAGTSEKGRLCLLRSTLLLTSVGLPDISIGDETFDRRFIVQTDDAETATHLLHDVTLREDLIRADVNSVDHRHVEAGR